LAEQQALMARAHEKLTVPKRLLADDFFADAVSRAYYAMFYAARALLAARDVYPKTHRGVISQFGLLFVKPGHFERAIFDFFVRAHEDREEADYGVLAEIEVEEAKELVEAAEVFVEACEHMRD
jgi:uncharacterized protein (UPF0332 family)